MGLYNIKLQDQDFYDIAQEDSVITIDKDSRTMQIEGYEKVFPYRQSDIEATLLEAGGVLPLYSQFGKKVFRRITAPRVKTGKKRESSRNSLTMGLLDKAAPLSFEW